MGIASVSRFLWRNGVDAASLAVTSEASGYPVLMLQDPSPSMLWKSTSTAAQTITLTWAARQFVQAVALANHNLTHQGTITVTDGVTTQVLDAWESIYPFGSGTFGSYPIGGFPSDTDIADMQGQPVGIWYLTTPIYATAMQITLTDAANPDGYLSAGKLFTGPYLEPSKMFQSEHLIGTEDLSEYSDTPGGQRLFTLRPSLNKLQVQYQYLTETEGLISLRSMLKGVGRHTPLFFDAFAAGPAYRRFYYNMLARIDGDVDLTVGVIQRGSLTIPLRQAA